MINQPAALTVTGTGVGVDNTPFYVVPSQTELGRSHLVRQLPTHLVCDCKAAKYGRQCAHVASVVVHKQRQQLALAMAEDAVLETKAASAPRETPVARRSIPAHPGDSAILRRSNRPFSLLA